MVGSGGSKETRLVLTLTQEFADRNFEIDGKLLSLKKPSHCQCS